MNFCKNCDNVLTLKLEAVKDLGEETSKDMLFGLLFCSKLQVQKEKIAGGR